MAAYRSPKASFSALRLHAQMPMGTGLTERSAGLIAVGVLIISGAFFLLLAKSKAMQQYVLRKAAAKAHGHSSSDPAERESLVSPPPGAPPKSCLAQVVPGSLAQVVVRPDADRVPAASYDDVPLASLPLATETGGVAMPTSCCLTGL
jgi:hypothetical protein